MGDWHHSILVDSHKSLVDSHKHLVEFHTCSLSHAQNVAAADMLRISQYGRRKWWRSRAKSSGFDVPKDFSLIFIDRVLY